MQKNTHIKFKSGFTLIELLLVITLISILISIRVVSLNTTDRFIQARNQVRQSAMKRLESAVTQYRVQEGVYPTGLSRTYQEICDPDATSCSGFLDLRTFLIPTFLQAIPQDPKDIDNIGGGGYSIAIDEVTNTVSVKSLQSEGSENININDPLPAQESTTTNSPLAASVPSTPPSPIVTSGLTLYLDAGNTASYPGSGAIWNDISGNGFNGTLAPSIGGPTFNSTNGGTIVFDGSNDYVSLGTPAALNGVQVPLTICGWFKSSSSAGNRTVYGVYRSTSSGNLYSMVRLDSGILKYYASNSSGGFQSAGSLSPSLNNWNFYAVTVSGTLSAPSVTIYLNTSSQSFSYGAFTSSPNLTVDFRVGSNQYGEYFQGSIAQLLVYTRALSASEIQQNYNVTKTRFGL